MQHPKSDVDEGDAEYEFPELEWGFDLRKSEREPDIPVGGEVDPRQCREPKVRVGGLARPASLTKTHRRQHYLEGHANYHPGCPFCVRCRGLADRHERKQDEEDQHAGVEVEQQEVPTISFDFCFLMQKDQGKSIPTLVARDHRSCYTHVFTCSGKSTKEADCSEDVVHKCKIVVEMFGHKRVAMKSDQ